MSQICLQKVPFGQAIRLRRIISDDIVLVERLKELETWFTNRGFNSKKVKPEIERVKNHSGFDLPSGSNKVYEILQKTHRHTLKSQCLTAVLPSPPRLTFCNAKTLKDHLVRSKLKTTYEKTGVTI